MPSLSVDKELCISCKLCVRACPAAIIAMDDAAIPFLDAPLQHKCISCGHCSAICPVDALSLDFMPIDTMPLSSLDEFSFEQLEALVRNRRSIRCFEKKPVSKDTIAQLLRLASFAPTARNLQQVGWMVISSAKELKNFSALVIEWVRILAGKNAASFAAISGDSLLEAWAQGKDPILRNAPYLLIAFAPTGRPMAMVDSIIALSYADMLAPALGLGTCWAGYLMGAMQQHTPLEQALNLPPGMQPYGALMLGFAQSNYRRWPARKKPGIIWM